MSSIRVTSTNVNPHFQQLKTLVEQPSSRVEVNRVQMHGAVRHHPPGQFSFEVSQYDRTRNKDSYVTFRAKTDTEGQLLSPGVEIQKGPDFKMIASQAMSKVLFGSKIVDPLYKALFP